jgi:hypothetical protein
MDGGALRTSERVNAERELERVHGQRIRHAQSPVRLRPAYVLFDLIRRKKRRRVLKLALQQLGFGA